MGSSLPARALWTGAFLILISTLAIMVAGFTPTALIPGALGLVIALMGIWADKTPAQRPLAMNIALGLAALGMLGSLGSVPDFITLVGGGTVELPVATMAQFATLFICLGLVIRWVVESRRKAQP